MRVLDLGAGRNNVARQMFPDADVVRVDINENVQPDVVADVRELPDDLGEFDAIVASHLLEHFGRTEATPLLQHWFSHLKSGGELHIMVPDLVWAAEELVKQRVTVHLLMHIYGSQGGENQYHKFGYTMLLLRDLVERAGYTVRDATTAMYGIQFPLGTEPVRARMLYVKAVKP